MTNIVFKESEDPNDANIRLFAGTIAPSSDFTVRLDGGQNPLTDRSTIMSYNIAEPDQSTDGKSLKRGVFKILAPADLDSLQRIYGKPQETNERVIITPQRLADRSSVLWDHKPMALKLTASPQVGAATFDEGDLTVDLGARVFSTPAITGTLKKNDGTAWRVSQHIGNGASISDVDATGSNIKLNVTGAQGARITPNKGATVNLKGRNNAVVAGAGNNTITFLQGFGNVATGVVADDTITASSAKKVHLQYWDQAGHEKGTLMTFIGDDGARKGSLFMRDMTPEEVRKRMKDLITEDKLPAVQAAPATTLNDPQDYDITLTSGNTPRGTADHPSTINYGSAKDIIVTARLASGFKLTNFDGPIAIKMTKAEFESRRIVSADDKYYTITFNDGDKVGKFTVQKNVKLAVTGDDGKIVQTVLARETLGGEGNVKEVEANAVDHDAKLENAAEIVKLSEDKDVMFTAGRAAGHTLGNTGKGDIIIKMTQPEYESRTIKQLASGYKLSFRDADGIKDIIVPENAKIAVTGPDGKLLRAVSVKDALKEFELDLALRKGTSLEKDSGSALVWLPLKAKKMEGQAV